MNPILKLLNRTSEEYECMYFGAYWRWCESISVNEAETQMVLANAGLNKYYRMEYAKLEAEFLELIKRYPNATQKEVLKLYADCTYGMFNRRCAPLIREAKRNNIINQITL